MARLACDNAEGIKYIQANAFLNVKPGYVYLGVLFRPFLWFNGTSYYFVYCCCTEVIQAIKIYDYDV